MQFGCGRSGTGGRRTNSSFVNRAGTRVNGHATGHGVVAMVWPWCATRREPERPGITQDGTKYDARMDNQ